MTRLLSRRTSRTTLLFAFAIALAAAGCDGVADLPGDARPETSDLPDQETIDIRDEAAGDEGVSADAPPTCGSFLKDWQCLDISGCAAWEVCTGPVSCEVPPCWGDYCQDYPGVCVAKALAIPCRQPTDCKAEGATCAGLAAPGDTATWGGCRALPDLPGACFGDLDCTGNDRCSGATTCRMDRLGPCTPHPGRCAPPSLAGECLTDSDCAAGSTCRNATLCALGAASCQDQPGTCEVGGRPGCATKADCKTDPTQPFCVGAGPGRAGYCSPAPALHQGECWEDQDCGDQDACLGAAPCPPGDRCRAGGLHGGYCGPFPQAGTAGVEITFLPKAGPDGVDQAVIRNGLPVAIAFSACFALDLQTRKDQTWNPELSNGGMMDPLCNQETDSLLRLPAGGSRVLTGIHDGAPSPNNPNRLVLFYRMGCDSADVANLSCRIQDRVAFSAEFK